MAFGLSCSAKCEIFLAQGSNPCPLHWQVDSYPLCHQGSYDEFLEAPLAQVRPLLGAGGTSARGWAAGTPSEVGAEEREAMFRGPMQCSGV